MAITVIRDLINGHEYQEDDRTGEMTRCFRVDGLPSVSNITDLALIAVDSVNALIKVPQAGDPHETMTDMVVRAVRPTPVPQSKHSIKVYVTYRKVRRRLLDVTVGGVTQQSKTNRDIHGKIMTVGYLAPDTIGGAPVSPATAFPDPATELQKRNSFYKYCYVEVPFLLPDLSLEITYLEDTSPIPKWQKYGRRLNSVAWQGGQPREWLCENISGRVDSPIPYNLGDLPDKRVVTGAAKFFWIVVYRFRFLQKPTQKTSDPTRGDTQTSSWDPLALFVDQQTGRQPLDIDPKAGGWPDAGVLKPDPITGIIKGNGWAQFQIYGEADFNDLKLVSAVELGLNP